MFFNTISMLRDHGHEVRPWSTVHPKNDPSEYDGYFAPYRELRDMGTADKLTHLGSFFRNRTAERQLDRMLKDWKPDVAHLHNIFNGLGLGILKVLHRHNVAVVMTLHDMRFICPALQHIDLASARCRRCMRLGYIPMVLHNCQHSRAISTMSVMEMFHKERLFHYNDYIDRYILLNNVFRHNFGTHHSWFEEKGKVLYNFVPIPHEVPDTRRGKYVLFLGRLSPEKGIGTLLKAAEMVPEVDIHIAGDGPLRTEVEKSGLPNVTYKGYLSGLQLQHEIEGCSFVAVPSEWQENNPLSVIESNAAGKPVIAAEIGGIPEIVVEGLTGFLFTSGDVDGLASMLRRQASMTDGAYAQMSANAFVFARENFSPDRHYATLMEIYREAIMAGNDRESR